MSFLNVLFGAIPFVVPGIFVLAGMLWVLRGVRQVRGAQEFRETARPVAGVVTDMRSRWRSWGTDNHWRVFYPVLRFTTAQGQVVETVSFTGHRHTSGLEVGERVDILYSPADPTRACVDSAAGTSLAVLIRPALLWAVLSAISPDLASMGGGGPYMVERLGAGAVLVLLLAFQA